jgi:hypothetical protein
LVYFLSSYKTSLNIRNKVSSSMLEPDACGYYSLQQISWRAKNRQPHKKNAGAPGVVHISRESRAGYGVFSIGWHGERRNVL